MANPPVTAITTGKDYNFFTTATISDTSFPANPQVIVNVKFVKNFSLVNYGSVKVEYSFNGNTVHGDMRPNTPTSAIFFDNRQVFAIWFRVPSSSAEVRVEAWGS